MVVLSWFTTVPPEAGHHDGLRQDGELSAGYSFGQGQILAAAHEAPTALPGAFVTL